MDQEIIDIIRENERMKIVLEQIIKECDLCSFGVWRWRIRNLAMTGLKIKRVEPQCP